MDYIDLFHYRFHLFFLGPWKKGTDKKCPKSVDRKCTGSSVHHC